jgi:hypothetical protein
MTNLHGNTMNLATSADSSLILASYSFIISSVSGKTEEHSAHTFTVSEYAVLFDCSDMTLKMLNPLRLALWPHSQRILGSRLPFCFFIVW